MPTFELLVVAVLILLNGVFSMSELALVSVRRARLSVRAERGSLGARAALVLLDDPGGFLAAIQIGITLIGILTGVYGGSAFAAPLAAWLGSLPITIPYAGELAFGVVVLLITFVSLVFGELVPKRVALLHAEAIAVLVAPPMRVFAQLLMPLVWLLRIASDAILRVLPLSAAPQASVSEDEVRALIAEGTRAGVFLASERRLIEGVLALADRKVDTVMVPRQDIVWLDLDEPVEQLWRQAKASGHARFLAARGELEALAGTITLANLSEALRRGELQPKTDLDPALHVPDTLTVLQLLDEFRRSSVHLAVITDEYGGIEGVATPADILKTIAGELPELGSRERPEVIAREDGSWLVDGHLPIEELQRTLGRTDMAQHDDYHTVAGFVLARLGRVPRAGDTLTWRGVAVEVVDMDGARIDKLIIRAGPKSAR